MPAATASEVERLQRAARRLDTALTAVAAGALAFSTVNVALLAIDHGIPPWVAWMLEPLVGIALWAVLSSDAVLSGYGRAGGGAARTLRMFTGAATLTMNVWDSVFTTSPSGDLTWEPEPTGILLHSIAPVLLILLAEAAPRYRAEFTAIATALHAPERTTESMTPHRDADPERSEAAKPGAVGDEWVRGPDSEATPSGPEPDPTGGRTQHRRSQAKRGSREQRRARRAANDAKALAILRRHPYITGAELAHRLGVQPRSGQRILNRVTTGVEHPVGGGK